MADGDVNAAVTTMVGIVASAGGLEALTSVVQNLPSDLNCSYVVAQHMSPTHKSLLVDLLARETNLSVFEIHDRTIPAANTIYIPPPGHDAVVENGAILLKGPAGAMATPKPSGDRLFASIASDFGEHSVAVVLSGTGSDGSYGVQAIREAGGITIAQDPITCKYESMPQSAIRTGCIDLTLTPQQIGQHIGRIQQLPRDLEPFQKMYEQANYSRDIFQILLSQKRLDFRNYKEATTSRRIQRRMVAKGITTYADYVDLCRRSVEEVDALFKDLLISVTRFFRDGDQFDALRDAIRERAAKQEINDPMRIWVAGCATGEEAYSIAITCIEELGGLDKVGPENLQIFATDIDDAALDVARKGIYNSTALLDIPDEYRDKYFDLNEDTISVRRQLRKFILFSNHNVFQDAPFVTMDLISARNILIYFNSKLQERVLTRFAYSLVPDGVLFLGTSESVGKMDKLFQPIMTHGKLFTRRKSIPRTSLIERTPDRFYDEVHARSPNLPTGTHRDWTLFDSLAASVAPEGVLINRDQTILRVFGDITRFCTIDPKSFGNNNLSILKKRLASDAASLALVSLKYRENRKGQIHKLGDEANAEHIQLTAYPIVSDGVQSEPMVLIGFNSIALPNIPKPEDPESEYLSFVEDELHKTRDALQVTIEQLQTSNEELQAVNEEMQSANEELQSTNEELETSNEELQSTNEELITVNEELLVNSSQLEQKSEELLGMMENISNLFLMVDLSFMIRYASAKAVDTLKLQERGDGYGHISQCFVPKGYPDLIDQSSLVLRNREEVEIEFTADGISQRLLASPIIRRGGELVGIALQTISE